MKSFRISRIIVTGLILLASITAVAQDSYREALKDYLALSQKSTYEQIFDALKQLNPMVFERVEGMNYDQMTTAYINDRFGEIMADLWESAMRETVTENDLRTAKALMSTPEGIALNEHATAWSKQFAQDIKDELQQPLITAMTGMTISPVIANSEIPKSYVQKFMQYMDNTHGAEQFISAFNQGLAQHGVELPDAFQDWLADNVGTLAMNSAYGTITNADLDYSASLFTNDSYRRVIDCASSLTNNLMSVGMTCVLDYIDWMGDQGIPLSEVGAQVVEYYKQQLGVEE